MDTENHKGEDVSAVGEYRKNKVYLAEVCGAGTLEDLADAAIAEGKAENERLRRAYDDLHREWVRTLGRARRVADGSGMLAVKQAEAEEAGAVRECIECGSWCPIFNPRGECVARDPGEHCAIVLAAKIARADEPQPTSNTTTLGFRL